jgi:hypothetical protein
MASYSAKLEIDGQQYPVVLCTYSFTQATAARGRVNERVRHGLLELVLDVPAGDQLLLWAATPHYPLDGHVSFYQSSEFMARETVSFKAGQCVSYQEVFEAGADLVGSYRCALTIAAPKLALTTGGPPGSPLSAAASAASKVTSVATKVAAVAAVASGAAAAAGGGGVAAAIATTASPAHWLDTLVEQLQAGPDVRKTVGKWLANGVSEDKLKAAMQKPDFQQTFIRLAVADKGLYQQHVILDDYDAIPGVSKSPYVSNSLPLKTIAASNFGVNDSSLDLPPAKAQTFTDQVRLVKLEPGDTLYRVACDPATDPHGRTGGYWTRTPPAALADVVGGTAVMPEWNNYQQVYKFTVPDPALDPAAPTYHAWEGPAAAQPVSGYYEEKTDNGHCLAGGDNQLFIPSKLAFDPQFGTYIKDVTFEHKTW